MLDLEPHPDPVGRHRGRRHRRSRRARGGVRRRHRLGRAPGCGDLGAALARASGRTFATNVAGTHAVLEAARAAGVSSLAFASTNAVTGPMDAPAIVETRALRPLTPYGATKAAAEMLMSAYTASYGVRCVCLRLTNVYGPGMQAKDSIVARLMRAIRLERDFRDLRRRAPGPRLRPRQRRDRGRSARRWSTRTGSGPVVIGSGQLAVGARGARCGRVRSPGQSSTCATARRGQARCRP